MTQKFQTPFSTTPFLQLTTPPSTGPSLPGRTSVERVEQRLLHCAEMQHVPAHLQHITPCSKAGAGLGVLTSAVQDSG